MASLQAVGEGIQVSESSRDARHLGSCLLQVVQGGLQQGTEAVLLLTVVLRGTRVGHSCIIQGASDIARLGVRVRCVVVAADNGHRRLRAALHPALLSAGCGNSSSDATRRAWQPPLESAD